MSSVSKHKQTGTGQRRCKVGQCLNTLLLEIETHMNIITSNKGEISEALKLLWTSDHTTFQLIEWSK